MVTPELGGDAIQPWGFAARTPPKHGRDRGGRDGVGACQEGEVCGEGCGMSGDGMKDGLLGHGVAGLRR